MGAAGSLAEGAGPAHQGSSPAVALRASAAPTSTAPTSTAPAPAARFPAARAGGFVGGRARRATAALAPAAAVLAAWLIVDPRTPDLAAQVYRAGLFGRIGFAVWDEHWYAGHHLPGYSLLFPPLASLVGVRAVAIASVLASAALFERILRGVYGRAAPWGAAAFALAAAGDAWMGRLSFALGVPFALAAVLALMHGRRGTAAALAAMCAAASPVAGLLLGLAALTRSLYARSPAALLVLGAPVAAVVLALALLFPEGGSEPFPLLSFAATVAVVAVFLSALPSGHGQLRAGALVYLLACTACLALATPMGSNIERYGVLLAAPLLACALLTAPQGRPGRARVAPAGALALAAIALWVAWGPVRETLAVAGNESTRASYYVPLERFLARAGGGPSAPLRVEVPLTRSHWEAALLAPSVSLARGWEKQLDTRFDRVLLSPGLTAAGYQHWLREQAVDYVALPDTPLDPSSAREGRLIRAGLPYLREVFASRHWRVYAVRGATPLASGPALLTALGDDSFTLRARAPGRVLVRVHFTRYFTLAGEPGCVRPAPGGWTALTLDAAGTVRVQARFSLGRAFSPQGSCSGARAASRS